MMQEMTLGEASELAQYVAGLVEGGEPITFYDALELTRRARQDGELDAPTIARLIAAHDAEQSTDGARNILFDYLRAYARRLASERELGARTITLEDGNRLARAAVGSSLRVQLPLWRPTLQWRLCHQSGPGKCREERPAAISLPYTEFVIELDRPGRSRFELEERSDASAAAPESNRTPARRFVLLTVAEARR